jgi:hypothetical protein
MTAFLVLTSLSVAFYLVMLVALYRDSRQRLVDPGSAYTIKLGVVANIGTSPDVGRMTAANQRQKPNKVPLWVAAGSAPHQPETAGTASSSPTLVFFRAPAHDKDDMLCN